MGWTEQKDRTRGKTLKKTHFKFRFLFPLIISLHTFCVTDQSSQPHCLMNSSTLWQSLQHIQSVCTLLEK